MIRQRISETYPDHGIYGEEFGLQAGNGLTWVIDPIDGTRAFMSGMLHWGVLLALFDGENPIVGVLYRFIRMSFLVTELWRVSAPRARAIAQNHRWMSCLRRPPVPRAPNGWLHVARTIRNVSAAAQLNCTGGDCYLFGLVAMGQMHIGLDGSLNPYDIQALIPIIRGAGGVITTWDGGNPSMGGHTGLSQCSVASAGLGEVAKLSVELADGLYQQSLFGCFDPRL